MKVSEIRVLLKEQQEKTNFIGFKEKRIVDRLRYLSRFDTDELNREQLLTLTQSFFVPLSHANEILDLLDMENFQQILGLTASSIRRLDYLIKQLINHNLLTKTGFEKALHSICAKLPPVHPSVPETYKIDSDSTEIKVNDFHFLIHNRLQKQLSGNLGVVNPGYTDLKNPTPDYAIKKLMGFDSQRTSKIAAREVKYNLLIERKAAFFVHTSKSHIVSEWQPGQELYDEQQQNQSLFLKWSIAERLHLIIPALAELNVLHAHYRMHGDIKPENIILTLEPKPALRLIDFGSSRKMKNSPRGFSFTPNYLDRTNVWQNSYNFCDDIYSMGIIIAYIFPDLFLSYANEELIALIEPLEVELRPETEAIFVLVAAMMDDDRLKRCGCEAVLNYLTELAAKLESKSEIVVDELAEATIKQQTVTVDDVIHGTFSM